MSHPRVDFLLLKATPKDPQQILILSTDLKNNCVEDFKSIEITFNAEVNELYAYFYLQDPLEAIPSSIQQYLVKATLINVQLCRMQTQLMLHGASKDSITTLRYVVEMDFEKGWEDELVKWYDGEHLNGLASSPGCVSATRCYNLDHAPMSFAFYDLESNDVTNTPEWLAVRNTAWSDQVRPHFMNVKRTRFHFV
jgi:hypothetical protein